ncbi:glycosyltransferase family 2 protein [Paraburkholderia lycopersici]|uniref:Glycosyltransferase, catalytic subunit of cellulose synthase and poly-beta-1,6-N-acetylglucosamine synthase n=1 Tax=Paraburkholderia lycopersici TaxID=416944 RepID=A0A1G7CB27_9BURK|nr:glycosyltransferase family A protein [Paraburkholderia lycopersici]SDE36537.1 Glycosyltransferase, catalytic subunit of cellulose synthase and poly-beta-1,6-N-acetylglucosamine synthase [Paraburkholderia lycopersici]
MRPADVELREPRPIGAEEPRFDGYAGALLEHLRIAVVVPTYHRATLLGQCLTALCAQDLSPDDYEIVVCDDGPDDETRATVERMAAMQAARGLAIRYVPVRATQGPAAARNAGWRAARAPLIAFTDDDTIADPGWLRAGLAALAHAQAAAGRIVVPLGVAPSDYERDASGLAHAEFATANAFVQRATLSQIGGFDERFTAAWREDSDLQFALLQAGASVVRADDAVVVHPVRPARWGVSLAQQRKSRFEALLFRKHPALYRERIGAGPPLLYYAVLISVLVLLASLAWGQPRVALAAFAAWIACTAAFCVRRLRGTRRDALHVAEMIWTSLWIPFLSIFWRLQGAASYRVWFL